MAEETTEKVSLTDENIQQAEEEEV